MIYLILPLYFRLPLKQPQKNTVSIFYLQYLLTSFAKAHDALITEALKGHVATFLLVYFLSLKESTCETRKNVVFLFDLKSSFCSQDNRSLEFYILKVQDVIK